MAPSVLLFTHLFLTVASAVVGKAARDAIFLGRFTPLQMTGVDLATMAWVAVVVGLQLRLGVRLPVRRALILAPLCLAAGDAALWLGLSSPSPRWMAWMVYVWVGVQASLVAPHACVLTGHVLSLRRAKQVCGGLGAGAIAGWIVGGLVARLFAPRLGASSLLLASGLMTALCPVIVSMVWPAGEDALGEARKERRAGSLHASAWLVWRSPHLRAMATPAFLTAVVTTIAGLQFKVIASQSVHGADHLAALFGSFSVYAGLVALATQLVVTPRVIARFGLGPALAIAPIALAAGSLGVLWSGTLAAAIFLKGSDQVLRYSVDRAATETLYRPLPARDVFEGKTFIDAIVCRCGDAVGAMLVLFAAGVLHLSFRLLGVLTLPLIVAWLLSARAAQGTYRARLLDDLSAEISSASSAEPGRALATGRRVGATVMTRGVLDPDPTRRLQVLRALTAERPRHPRPARANTRLATALAAEIVGFSVLVEEVSAPGASFRARSDEGIDAIERISRLLFLLSPERYPRCLAPALRSRALSTGALAQAYLDTALASPHRQFLMSLLDRWARAAAADAVSTAPPALFAGSLAGVKRVWALLTNRALKGATS